jgi:hypothetical protein
MGSLFSAGLFWALLMSAMLVFGIACIKFGIYTSGNGNTAPTLEV